MPTKKPPAVATPGASKSSYEYEDILLQPGSESRQSKSDVFSAPISNAYNNSDIFQGSAYAVGIDRIKIHLFGDWKLLTEIPNGFMKYGDENLEDYINRKEGVVRPLYKHTESGTVILGNSFGPRRLAASLARVLNPRAANCSGLVQSQLPEAASILRNLVSEVSENVIMGNGNGDSVYYLEAFVNLPIEFKKFSRLRRKANSCFKRLIDSPEFDSTFYRHSTPGATRTVNGKKKYMAAHILSDITLAIYDKRRELIERQGVAPEMLKSVPALTRVELRLKGKALRSMLREFDELRVDNIILTQVYAEVRRHAIGFEGSKFLREWLPESLEDFKEKLKKERESKTMTTTVAVEAPEVKAVEAKPTDEFKVVGPRTRPLFILLDRLGLSQIEEPVLSRQTLTAADIGIAGLVQGRILKPLQDSPEKFGMTAPEVLEIELGNLKTKDASLFLEALLRFFTEQKRSKYPCGDPESEMIEEAFQMFKGRITGRCLALLFDVTRQIVYAGERDHAAQKLARKFLFELPTSTFAGKGADSAIGDIIDYLAELDEKGEPRNDGSHVVRFMEIISHNTPIKESLRLQLLRACPQLILKYR